MFCVLPRLPVSQEHFYLECHNTLAIPQEKEMLLHASTQNPAVTQVGPLRPASKCLVWFAVRLSLASGFAVRSRCGTMLADLALCVRTVSSLDASLTIQPCLADLAPAGCAHFGYHLPL